MRRTTVCTTTMYFSSMPCASQSTVTSDTADVMQRAMSFSNISTPTTSFATRVSCACTASGLGAASATALNSLTKASAPLSITNVPMFLNTAVTTSFHSPSPRPAFARADCIIGFSAVIASDSNAPISSAAASSPISNAPTASISSAAALGDCNSSWGSDDSLASACCSVSLVICDRPPPAMRSTTVCTTTMYFSSMPCASQSAVTSATMDSMHIAMTVSNSSAPSTSWATSVSFCCSCSGSTTVPKDLNSSRSASGPCLYTYSPEFSTTA